MKNKTGLIDLEGYLSDMDVLLNGNLYGTVALLFGTSIDFTGHRVDDEVRGYVYCGQKPSQGPVFCYQKPACCNEPMVKVAIILESPHKDEFDIYYKPLHPANGLTGAKINSKIVAKLQAAGLPFQRGTVYEIYLMNPVPYQCSMYHELEVADFGAGIYAQGYKHNRKYTDQVFSALFFGRQLPSKSLSLRADFMSRIDAYSPDWIFNCCTHSKKKVVEAAIKKTRTYQGYATSDSLSKYNNILSHPSAW